ncbi:non-ribosomal peptide synthetase [Nocardiopsis sp. FIRDI 009]|uniref:non-ribosomal peptide synthetase n=1 Tax=Nocardiopsis sp. FIRDI 009 TaxID=714197 RepID=UPI000E25DC63|nr:non-ribosomal peptide synthetase [Nocardiopsis sp. FIRDI 009]
MSQHEEETMQNGPEAEPLVFPVTFAQQRLMIIEQLFPGTAAYHVPFALRLRGVLDRDALLAAVRHVVDRHESLRTVFTTVDGGSVQMVLPRLRPPLHEEDLSGTPEAADEERLVARLGADARVPFAIDEALVRVALLRLGPEEHVLAVTMHHLVSDMWSCGIFVREIAESYPAFLAGEAPRLPEPPVQYVDYTAWQHENLTEEVLADLARFWRKELGGAPPVLELPSDRPRPPVQTFRGDMLPIRLSPEVSRRIRELSGELGATPYMTVLAAFQAVVGRWARTRDVVVSTGVATRTAETESLIGCFINIVLFRTSLEGDPTFTELVERVRGTVLRGFEHQELPFDRLVEEIAPHRDLSHQPLTQVMFVMQNAPMPSPVVGDLEISAVHVPRHATQVDLDLQMWDAGGHYEGFFEYSTDMFDGDTVTRLWAQFERLLTAAVEAPGSRLSALPLLSPSEVEIAVSGWNATSADTPDACLHELFEAQAARTPDAPALVYPGGALTYAELDARAERVASGLRAVGVGPETLVGSCLGPADPVRLPIFLGVLKAGGGHLPLDPEYPSERLSHMLTDARPRVLLTDDALIGRLPDDLGGARVLRVDDLPDGDGPVEGGRDGERAHPDNLAYVIYTSGSTGRPKGIAVPHRGVVNNIRDLNMVGGVGPGDRLLALSSASFDMSVYDMLGMLLAGGAVLLPDPERSQDPRHWADLVQRHGATVWNSAPALLEAFVDEMGERGEGAAASLRLAFLGGDWVAVSMPERFRRCAPGARFVVMGGATEASIHSTIHEVTDPDPDWTSIPYGVAMENQQVLLLDEHGSPVPVGVPGELYLGGLGLTRGYLDRPAMTADRFVPHPFAGRYPNVSAGARLYRTGDLARYRPDGVLELLGRVDHQTKIRGLRVELGEVASALRSHPEVAECVAATRGEGGEVRLVGYYVAEEGAEPTVASLRDHMSGIVPGYMVPSALVGLDRLPLSPNGKVDRSALPDPGTGRPSLATAYVEPGTPVEIVLSELWESVLGVDRVGAHDSFFELGGYSMAATRVAVLAGEVFGIELALRVVFDAPTIAEQARVVSQVGREQGVDVDAAAELALDVGRMSEEEVMAMLEEEGVR